MRSISTATASASTIHSTPDALASAANYLDGLGWKPGQPWLEEVRVPANMDWSQADVTIKKPRAYWAKAGVTYPSGKALPADNVPTALLLPMGRNGPAFLAYPNFDVYLQWNQSLVYSTSRRLLRHAPRRQRRPCRAATAPIEPMSQAQVKELQQILAKRGFDVGKTDGVIGASTREAVRAGGMGVRPAGPSGYPTSELLARRAGRVRSLAGCKSGTPEPSITAGDFVGEGLNAADVVILV